MNDFKIIDGNIYQKSGSKIDIISDLTFERDSRDRQIEDLTKERSEYQAKIDALNAIPE